MGIFSFMQANEPGPAGARGFRAYVVGDIHGRLDLLDRLLAEIDGEIAARPPRKILLVFLGDLIDRGPSSAQVVERLRSYRREGIRTVFLLGNHEEVLLRILDGDASLIASWTYGPGVTFISFGVASLSSSVTFEVSSTSVPPLAIASRALAARFNTICSICVGSARMRPRCGSETSANLMCSPMSRGSIVCMPASVALRLSNCGRSVCLRPKASSWRVKTAPLSAAFRISSIS